MSTHPIPSWFAPRLKPYVKQIEALERSWREEYFALLPEQGCGKTKISIDNICMLAHEGLCDGMLLFATKKLYRNWTRVNNEMPGELQKHMWEKQPYTVYVWDGSNTQSARAARANILKPSPGLRILAVNIEALSVSSDRAFDLCEAFLKSGRMMTIVDQNLLKSHSERTKALIALRPLSSYRRVLTGTVGTPMKIFWLFEFLKKGYFEYSNWVSYRARYCTLKEIWIKNRMVKTETGVQNIEELSERMYRYAYRVLKKDCMDLPKKVYQDPIMIEMSSEQKAAYKEMKTQAMVTLASGVTVNTQVVVTQLMKLHQIACGHIRDENGNVHWLKHGRVEALLEALEETDQQTIIWVNYKPEQKMLKERLEKEYGAGAIANWHGFISEREMEQQEIDFQLGRRRIILASLRMGAWGRTWTAASNVIYYTNNRDLEMRQESEDRAHRGGQTKSVSYTNIVTEGTTDEKMILALRNSKDIVRQILQDGIEPWI